MTKWGSKEDLVKLGAKAKEVGLGLYWDAVLNHKAGADRKEKCQAIEVDNNGQLSNLGYKQKLKPHTRSNP